MRSKWGLVLGLCVVLCGAGVSCVTPSTTQVKPWNEMDKAPAPPPPPDTRSAARERPTPPPPPRTEPVRPREPERRPEPPPPVANTASTPAPGSIGPRISHSLGEPGGYLVLWPRVIPSTGADGQRALALRIQSHLSSVVSRQARGRAVDVRPEPERACPRSSGCLAAASNVLLIHHSRGCVAVGMFTPPGGDTTRLIPLAGQISLKSNTIPFRDPPESQVVVHDFLPCSQVMSELMKRDADIEAAIRAAR